MITSSRNQVISVCIFIGNRIEAYSYICIWIVDYKSSIMLFFLKRNLGITALKRIFVGCSIYTIIKCSLQVFTQQRNSIFGIFFPLNHCTTIHIMFHHFLCFFHRNTVFQQIVCNVLCLFICESCHIILFLNRIIFLSKCRNSGCRNGRKNCKSRNPCDHLNCRLLHNKFLLVFRQLYFVTTRTI